MTVTSNALNINDDGLQDFDSTLGTFDATSLTTKGDLLGYTGSAYQRFPVGANGYVLKADNTKPVGWRWACPAFEFLSSQTASSSSTIEFTDFADSDCYNGYKLVWQNVNRSATNNSYRLRISVDNGSSWESSGYQWARESVRDDDGLQLFPYSASSTYIEINNLTGGTTRVQHFDGEMFFFNSSDPSTYVEQGLVFTSSNHTKIDQSVTSRGWALTNVASDINGLQIYMSAGTITTGEFHLYGMLL